MRADPVRQGLGPGRLGVGKIRGAEHGDKNLGVADLASTSIYNGDLLAEVVEEHFVARRMVLPHRRRESFLEHAKEGSVANFEYCHFRCRFGAVARLLSR
jgi:hypothetical protein